MHRGRALIIATSLYDRDPELTPLPSVVEDVAGLKSVLGDPRIGNFSVTTCLESAAHECSECIEDFFSQGGRDELQLLYISGHGVKDAEGELYFAVKNTLTRLLGATGVSSSFIKRATKRSKARGIVTILDTCFSGAFVGPDPKGVQVGVGDHFREGRGRVVITASDSFQHALGGQRTGDLSVRPSLFSSHVIQGLATGEADVDGNGEVSSKDLYDYVHERLQREGSGQRPQRWDFKQDGPDLVVATNPHPRPAALPPEVVALAQHELPSLRLDAIVRLRVLVASDSPPIVLAAQSLLERLRNDADPAVAGAAAGVLQGARGMRAPRPPAPQPEVPAQPRRAEAPGPEAPPAPPRRELPVGNATPPEPSLRSHLPTADPVRERPAPRPPIMPPSPSQATPGQGQASGSILGGKSRRMLFVIAGLGVVVATTVVALLPKSHELPDPAGGASVADASSLEQASSPAEKRSASPTSASQTSSRACPECPEMVSIQAGNFTMGSPATEKGRFDNESPPHRVHIAAFEVAKYPVSRGEWRIYANETGHKTRSGCNWLNPGFSQDDTHPAVCMSWPEAQSYITWLNGKSGQHYRFLTEAEYEYTNRAGTQTAYFWGDSDQDLKRYANINGKGTTPVGTFQANAWGLFDTSGNVWEWTQDCWHPDYKGAPADGRAWEAGGDCTSRVVRGGSWYDYSWYLRSASRNSGDNGLRDVGLRLARTE